jgi:ribosomal-protein-alanine N-acetyltransferase
MALALPLSMPNLETGRLRLRRFEEQDLEAALQWANDDAVFRYSFSDPPRNLTEAGAFLRFCFEEYENKGIGPWLIEFRETGEQIGNCWFKSIDARNSRIEINYFFGSRHWGKGLATETVEAMLRFGFSVLNANRMEARCMPGNIASERVARKAGMRLEAVLRDAVYAKGLFHDLKLYSILRREWLEAMAGQ